MKRRFGVSVLGGNKKVILTGDMLPIEVVIKPTEYISFDVQANIEIEPHFILFEERPEEVYLSIIKVAEAKGFVRARFSEEHDFIISHHRYNCKYDVNKQNLRIVCWKNGEQIFTEFPGKLVKIHVGQRLKATFTDRTETFDINS